MSIFRELTLAAEHAERDGRRDLARKLDEMAIVLSELSRAWHADMSRAAFQDLVGIMTRVTTLIDQVFDPDTAKAKEVSK